MLLKDVIRLSTRMFRTNKSRTLLTILGIGVGIGAILFLVSFGYGLQILIFNKLTTSDALLSLDVTTGDITNLKINQKIVDDFSSMEEIEKVIPIISSQAKLTIDQISSELKVNFADPEFFKLDGTVVSKGDFYKQDDEDLNKIVISSSALKLFNLETDDVFEKNIKISVFKETSNDREEIDFEKEFKVVGVIDEDSQNYIFLPFANSKKVGFNNYDMVKIKISKKELLPIAREKVLDKGFIVSSLSDIVEQANQVFNIIKIVLASFGIIALIVSAIGMFNTMTITLLERTQEIGIMKALGATDSDIWFMFIFESVIIGFFGGLCGILIGLFTGEMFNYGLNFLAGFLGGESIDLFFTPIWFIGLIIFFSTFVGMLTGFYPAKRAAQINCLDALRYK